MLDWAEAWGHDVYVVNQTASLGAVNVAGPPAPVAGGVERMFRIRISMRPRCRPAHLWGPPRERQAPKR